MLETLLTTFGLDTTVGKVYITLLELNTARASTIASRCAIPRPTVYDALEKLKQKGLVGSFIKRGTTYFIADEPERLQILLNDQQRILEQLLPLLQQLKGSGSAQPTVKYFEGVQGVKTVFEDTLTAKGKQQYCIFSIADILRTPGKRYLQEYSKKRVQKGIWVKVIRSKVKEVEGLWRNNPKELRELRYAPPGYVFSVSLYLYDDKLAVMSAQGEYFGLIIQSKVLTINLKNLFDALWHASTPA